MDGRGCKKFASKRSLNVEPEISLNTENLSLVNVTHMFNAQY